MSDAKRNFFVALAFVFFCFVVPLISCLRTATPDEWGEVVALVAIVVVGFVILCQVEGKRT